VRVRPPFAAIVSRLASSVASPRCASAITDTSPAHDTSFGSSNRASIAASAVPSVQQHSSQPDGPAERRRILPSAAL
jgi:hypothetical protein